MQLHRYRRVALLLALVLALSMALLATEGIQAQTGDSDRTLEPNQPVTGRLDADNFAESYIFAASAGDVISLNAITGAEDMSLALLLTDPAGVLVASDGDLSTPETAIISAYELEATGTYVVTVMRGTGADGDASGAYTLTLSGDITPPEEAGSTAPTAPTIRDGNDVYISTENSGVEISLQWAAAVDLNLEIRDPVGGTLYFDSLSTGSGGTHDGDINGICDEATAESPTESVSWPSGYVPIGSYEIIVYYEQSCSVGGPQSFVLTGNFNDGEPQSITGIVNPGQSYLARVTVDIDRNWALFNGGVNAGLDLSPTAAQEITSGQTVFGTITNQKPKDAYTFDTLAGQIITVDMTATSGSLDALVILLGPDGRLVASNDDDPAGGTTNSLLEVAAPSDGTYTIIATRYGQVIGGTEGNYTLFVGVGISDTVDATPVPEDTTPVITVPDGSVEIRLEWFTGADLQLQVRDPSGATVYDDVPAIASGGILDQNFVGNRGCVPSQDVPSYYIYWPTTRFPPSGTYEVEVWYQDNCDDPTPVNFNLSIEVNGQLLAAPGSTSTVTSTATTEGTRYMITFTLDDAGTVTLGEGGIFDMNSVTTGLDYQAALATAQPIAYGTTIQGSITQDQKFVVYQFEGRAGDRIGIEMTRTGNNTPLDTAIYIVDSTGAQLDGNDDIEPGVNTNSRISELQLPPFDGTYYIIATHYGLQYGATTGEFTLRLTQFP